MPQFGSIHSVMYHAISTKDVTLGLPQAFEGVSQSYIVSFYSIFWPSDALPLAYMKSAGLLRISQPFDLNFS